MPHLQLAAEHVNTCLHPVVLCHILPAAAVCTRGPWANLKGSKLACKIIQCTQRKRGTTLGVELSKGTLQHVFHLPRWNIRISLAIKLIWPARLRSGAKTAIVIGSSDGTEVLIHVTFQLLTWNHFGPAFLGVLRMNSFLLPLLCNHLKHT